MKFNLKNRPKINALTLREDVEEWFEGFEKELREIQFRQREVVGKQSHTFANIEEILGDSEASLE